MSKICGGMVADRNFLASAILSSALLIPAVPLSSDPGLKINTYFYDLLFDITVAIAHGHWSAQLAIIISYHNYSFILTVLSQSDI